MVGYEEVVDILCAFKIVCLSIVTYNKQDLCYIMMKLVRTIGKHVPPHSVEHHGALTGALNITAQYNTTQKSLKSVLLLRGLSRPPHPLSCCSRLRCMSPRNDIYQTGLLNSKFE